MINCIDIYKLLLVYSFVLLRFVLLPFVLYQVIAAERREGVFEVDEILFWCLKMKEI